MEIPNDFRELLASFSAGRVEYLLVGGYALAHHGAPRYTGDLDLLTSLDGVSWEDAAREAETGALLDETVPVIGRAAFVANKRATGRPSDLADLEALGES